MKAKSIIGKASEEIKTALVKCMADGYKPTLAIVFISNVEDIEAITRIMSTEGIIVFGASTAQKFTEDGLDYEGSIVVLLLDMKPKHFSIVLKEYKELPPVEAAKSVAKSGLATFKNPGFIISTIDTILSGEELIDGFVEIAGKDVAVMGGAAGNPADFSGVVFTNAVSSTRGIIALIIDQDKVKMSGLAVSGWKPVGTEKKITKSDGPWIFTIDGEPAVDLIQKFLGEDILTNRNHATGLLPSDLGYPLQFEREPGSFLMRPLLLWNTTDKSVMVSGTVNEGEKFRFSLPPDFDVIDKVIDSTKKIKEKEMPDVDALLTFSCVGRLGSFGPMVSTEIEGLASTWNKPMIGFFSLGEFGKLDNGSSEFHGTTVSWVALKEK
ncbi:hypothetical protein ATE92_1252 [Ulvibacter sp. MAR_2010_11]|uniref:FIST signal transduction protein n=1 Tax=Ulvibacter sp. MAR_2010_11 TaxID=1250229 RepID=UPI000CA8400E|nr:FIST N-terminal domain-containing protein [Ulvibacter sp. MAR_2010_11]PKA83106.1 hypothetical protein ATE92_1252 [Ulvibacter sp. MAR_2010_11]